MINRSKKAGDSKDTKPLRYLQSRPPPRQPRLEIRLLPSLTWTTRTIPTRSVGSGGRAPSSSRHERRLQHRAAGELEEWPRWATSSPPRSAPRSPPESESTRGDPGSCVERHRARGGRLEGQDVRLLREQEDKRRAVTDPRGQHLRQVESQPRERESIATSPWC